MIQQSISRYLSKGTEIKDLEETSALRFIAALSSTAKLWKQPCVQGWMDKDPVVYTYNGILLSLKRRKSCHLQPRKDLEDIMQSEISQAQRQTPYHLTCMRNPKLRKQSRMVVELSAAGGAVEWWCSWRSVAGRRWSKGEKFQLCKISKFCIPVLTDNNTVLYS